MEKNTSHHDSGMEYINDGTNWEDVLVKIFQFGFAACDATSVINISGPEDKDTLRGSAENYPLWNDIKKYLKEQGEHCVFIVRSHGGYVFTFTYTRGYKNPIIDFVFDEKSNTLTKKELLKAVPELQYKEPEEYSLNIYDNATSKFWKDLSGRFDDMGFKSLMRWDGGMTSGWPAWAYNGSPATYSSSTPFRILLWSKHNSEFFAIVDISGDSTLSLHEDYVSPNFAERKDDLLNVIRESNGTAENDDLVSVERDLSSLVHSLDMTNTVQRTKEEWQSIVFRLIQAAFEDCNVTKVTRSSPNNRVELTRKEDGSFDTWGVFKLVEEAPERSLFRFERVSATVFKFVFTRVFKNQIMDFVLTKYAKPCTLSLLHETVPEITSHTGEYLFSGPTGGNKYAWKNFEGQLHHNGYNPTFLKDGSISLHWPSEMGEHTVSSQTPFRIQITDKKTGDFIALLDLDENSALTIHEDYVNADSKGKEWLKYHIDFFNKTIGVRFLEDGTSEKIPLVNRIISTMRDNKITDTVYVVTGEESVEVSLSDNSVSNDDLVNEITRAAGDIASLIFCSGAAALWSCIYCPNIGDGVFDNTVVSPNPTAFIGKNATDLVLTAGEDAFYTKSDKYTLKYTAMSLGDWEAFSLVLKESGISSYVMYNGGSSTAAIDDVTLRIETRQEDVLESLTPFRIPLLKDDTLIAVLTLTYEENKHSLSLLCDYAVKESYCRWIKEDVLPPLNFSIKSAEPPRIPRAPQMDVEDVVDSQPTANALCSRKDAQDAAAINTLYSVVFEAVDSGFVNNFGVVSYDGQWLEKNYDPNEGTLYSYCQQLHSHTHGFGTIIGYLDDSPIFSFVYSPKSDRKILSFSRLCFESDGNYTVPDRLKDAYEWASRYDNGKSHILQFNSHSVEDWKYLSAQLTRRGLTDKIYVRSGYDRLSLSTIIHDMETTVGRSITSSRPITLPLVKDGKLVAILGFNDDGSIFVNGGYIRSEQDMEWIDRDIIVPMSKPADPSSHKDDYAEKLNDILDVLTYTYPVTTVLCVTGASQPEVVYEVRSNGTEEAIVRTDFPRSPYGLDMYIAYGCEGNKKYGPTLTFTIDSNNGNRVKVYCVTVGKPVFDRNPPAGLVTPRQKSTYQMLKDSVVTDFKDDFVGKGHVHNSEVIEGRMVVLRDWLTKLQTEGMELFYVGDRFKLHNLSRGMRSMYPSLTNPNYIIVQKRGKAMGLIEVSHTNRFMTLIGNYWGERKFNIRKWMSDANTLMNDISPDDFSGSCEGYTVPSVNLPDPKIIQNRARDMANSVMAFWNNSKFDDSINLAVEVVVEYLSYATLLNQTPEFDTRYWNAGFWNKVVSGKEKLVRTGPVHDELMHRIENTFVGNVEFHKRMEEATPTVTIFLAKINDIARFFLPVEG